MRERVNVVVSDDFIDHFLEVVDAVQRAGLDVEQELEEIGVVSGSIDHEGLANLSRIRGVVSVESERVFQLPPAWSETQ